MITTMRRRFFHLFVFPESFDVQRDQVAEYRQYHHSPEGVQSCLTCLLKKQIRRLSSNDCNDSCLK